MDLKTKKWLYVVIVFLYLLTTIIISYAQNSETKKIPVELANFVATNHLQNVYPEYKWRSLDYKILYDLDGKINGFAFVFSKEKSIVKTQIDLERHIIDKHSELLEAVQVSNHTEQGTEFNSKYSKIEEELYDSQNMATVITGASDDQKVILRHFRGLAKFWVESKVIQQSHVLMITPMDFRLLSLPLTKHSLSLDKSKENSRLILNEKDQVINVNTNKSKNLIHLKNRFQKIKLQEKDRIEKMPQTLRKKYEDSFQETILENRNKWNGYVELLNQRGSDSEVTK